VSNDLRFSEPPSSMTRARFLEVFGGVFEHSSWVAEAVAAAGLASRHDLVSGLHADMCAACRAAPNADQMALIRAHPDLAGRLALAGDMTADSISEQASAGLDRLLPDELSRFTALNDAYKARFGFPFIIAVRGLGKADILAAFEKRIGHNSEDEKHEALAQIERIVLLRLTQIAARG
jgi:2-oxo-4-hydroxy-4-carboxy-5-ureidoimidazoline decarboxylase